MANKRTGGPFGDEEKIVIYVRVPVTVASEVSILAHNEYVKPCSIYRKWIIERFLDDFPPKQEIDLNDPATELA